MTRRSPGYVAVTATLLLLSLCAAPGPAQAQKAERGARLAPKKSGPKAGRRSRSADRSAHGFRPRANKLRSFRPRATTLRAEIAKRRTKIEADPTNRATTHSFGVAAGLTFGAGVELGGTRVRTRGKDRYYLNLSPIFDSLGLGVAGYHSRATHSDRIPGPYGVVPNLESFLSPGSEQVTPGIGRGRMTNPGGTVEETTSVGLHASLNRTKVNLKLRIPGVFSSADLKRTARAERLLKRAERKQADGQTQEAEKLLGRAEKLISKPRTDRTSSTSHR